MKLNELIHKDIINLHLSATTKESLFQEMSAMLSKGGYINSIENFTAALYQREQEYSTGIGFGIAIPHARSKFVNKPVIAFGKSVGVEDYISLDDEVIKYIFMIAIPEETDTDYMSILSKLARRFMDETFREQIRFAETADDILAILEK